MSNNFSQNYAPELVGSVVEVAGGLIGRSLIDNLRKNFTSSSQVQRGDYFMDQSRVLLQNHLQLIELHEQNIIHRNYQRLRKAKQGLNSHDGTKFQKFLKARKYKRISKETYTIVKDASDRSIDNRLMNQIEEATRLPGSGPGSPPASEPESSPASRPGSSPGSGSGSPPASGSGSPPASGSGSGPATSTVWSNPFSDSHAISRLSEVSVNDLDRVEMSTYHEEATDKAAVVLDLVAQDESVQHVVATFSTEAFSGDMTDSGASQSITPEARAALSLHREDGSSPGFSAASLPDVSDQRADAQAETHTINSFTSTELAKSESNRSYPVVRASVQPADSDTYTRSCAPRRPL